MDSGAESFLMIWCFKNVFIYAFSMGNVWVIKENENGYEAHVEYGPIFKELGSIFWFYLDQCGFLSYQIYKLSSTLENRIVKRVVWVLVWHLKIIRMLRPNPIWGRICFLIILDKYQLSQTLKKDFNALKKKIYIYITLELTSVFKASLIYLRQPKN